MESDKIYDGGMELSSLTFGVEMMSRNNRPKSTGGFQEELEKAEVSKLTKGVFGIQVPL
ncbi:hypothetical protein TIFTF001_029827 [Ficus carica]|uniref:Uncharacterized protein n=1 Tax=Ficus carica TaxID=3494 RepID=A0AA88DSB3_FICCA|nr:hypothetical protein TIFTF001_029827 [Ficus carica]